MDNPAQLAMRVAPRYPQGTLAAFGYALTRFACPIEIENQSQTRRQWFGAVGQRRHLKLHKELVAPKTAERPVRQGFQ
jgi:hypothetical protein